MQRPLQESDAQGVSPQAQPPGCPGGNIVPRRSERLGKTKRDRRRGVLAQEFRRALAQDSVP